VSSDRHVSFELTPEGITILYDTKRLQFKSSRDIEPVKLAEQLGIEPQEALKLKLKIKDAELKAPLSLERLKEILGTTVKRDDTNKVIVFLCKLSTYTEDSQFNVSFRAPSSTGKSYIPLEIAEYFPPEDVMMVAYSSPTAFFHDSGEWDDEERSIIVDLERKILIFLDQPHDQLLQRLRPLLSHDKKLLLYKITDKSEKRGLRTKNVVLKGYPSVIFCSGSLRIDEQEQTRNILLSPETSQEKIREGIYLKAQKKANPIAFNEFLKQHPERDTLRDRIREIKNAHVKHVIVKDYEKVIKTFLERHSRLKPRHQRDIERIISLIQGLTLLNLWHRERDDDGNVYASDGDIEDAFKIYDDVGESQELGIPPYIYSLYVEVIKPLYCEKNKEVNDPVGLTRKEILKRHFEVYGRSLSESFLRQEILPPLENSGLVYQEPDVSDRRKVLVYCTIPGRNSEQHSGVMQRKVLLVCEECLKQGSYGKFTKLNKSGICELCGSFRELYSVVEGG
jgi:hypothetical protein